MEFAGPLHHAPSARGLHLLVGASWHLVSLHRAGQAHGGVSKAWLYEEDLDARPPPSANYSAPEIYKGLLLPASDVHSLGVLSYELMTGVLPFARLRREKLRRAYEKAYRPRVRDLLPDFPWPLDDLIGRAMAADPAARPSASVFGLRLEMWGGEYCRHHRIGLNDVVHALPWRRPSS